MRSRRTLQEEVVSLVVETRHNPQFASIKITRAAPALLRIEEAEMQRSEHFTKLIRDSSFRDYLDLFKFRSFEAKKSRHLDDLIWTYEIRGLSAESVYARRKLATLHCLRDVQTKAAYTFRRVKQTEFANNHFSLPLLLAVVCS